jgi:hypothetical protein
MRNEELYKFTQEVFAVIEDKPLISRAALNAFFRTTSDDKKNEALSTALSFLVTLEQVRKHAEDHEVFFWTAAYGRTTNNLPFSYDEVANPHPNPIDITKPLSATRPPEPEPTPAPTPAPTSAPSVPAPAVETKPIQGATLDEREAIYEKQKGANKTYYRFFVDAPTRIFGPRDVCFVDLEPRASVRGMTLGRMWLQGLVRRATDPLESTVTYYTLDGTFPPSLLEEYPDKGKAVRTRQERKAQVKKQQEEAARLAKEKEERAKLEQEETQEDADIPADEVETSEDPDTPEEAGEDKGEDSPITSEPLFFMDNKQNFQMIRSDGSHLTFDDAESSAIRSMIHNININKLKDT